MLDRSTMQAPTFPRPRSTYRAERHRSTARCRPRRWTASGSMASPRGASPTTKE